MRLIIDCFIKILSFICIYSALSSFKKTLFLLLLSIILKGFCQLFRGAYSSTANSKFLKEKHSVLKSTNRSFSMNQHYKLTDFTSNALKELRNFCKRPECDVWKLISKISRKKRFVDFIEKGHTGINKDEYAQYEAFVSHRKRIFQMQMIGTFLHRIIRRVSMWLLNACRIIKSK